MSREPRPSTARAHLGRLSSWLLLASPLKTLSLLVLFSIATVWTLAYTRAEQLYREGQTLESRGQIDLALNRYHWAMKAYSPLASAPLLAAESLWRISKDARVRGERALALKALDRLRGGLWSTQWLRSPFEEWRTLSDEAIATLRGAQEHEQNTRWAMHPHAQRTTIIPPITPSNERTLIDQHRSDLAYDPRPSPLRSFALSLSLIAWLYALYGLITRGFTARLERTEHAPRWALFLILCTCSWCLALW